MRFSEFFHLCLEKGMVSNKFNFKIFFDCFMSVARDDFKLPPKRFPYLLEQIGKKLLPGEKKPLETLIISYLGDKTVAVENRSIRCLI